MGLWKNANPDRKQDKQIDNICELPMEKILTSDDTNDSYDKGVA